MDFMKVLDQTVRELKREVNLKVLKVPEIEQKVLDATDNEPWGPHGSALAEIALATQKFTECQLVMNVLWTRLSETGKDWHYVYKALAVIEYLVAHGSKRAVDDIVEHTFQISALSSFEYVEPSGKDAGLNVRRKAENIVALLNDKDKIQEVRSKAAANRDKYFGLSSTGITYKSGSAAISGGSYQSGDKYGGYGSRDGEKFRDSYRDKGHHEEDKVENDYSDKSHDFAIDYQGNFKKGSARPHPVRENKMSTRTTKGSTNANDYDNYSSVPSQSSNVPANNTEDDFDDFDPRGTSTKASAGSSSQVDLFGQDLIVNLLDAPASVSSEKPGTSSVPAVDLFAGVAFESAASHVDKGANSQSQDEVDLFASQPAISSSVTSTLDLFSIHEPIMQPGIKSENSGPMNNNTVDPFAAVPLNKFDGSDIFGEFTSQSDSVSSQPSKNRVSSSSDDSKNHKTSADTTVSPKKGTLEVKSGIWTDSLSRGLIDLNISAPKKVSLADVGIVGGLSHGSDERVKEPPPSYCLGRAAMGPGSGLGMSGFTPSRSSPGNDIFSNLSSQQY